MIGEAIHDDTLKALVSQYAVHDVVVGRLQGDNRRWTLSVRLGGPTARAAVDLAQCRRGG